MPPCRTKGSLQEFESRYKRPKWGRGRTGTFDWELGWRSKRRRVNVVMGIQKPMT